AGARQRGGVRDARRDRAHPCGGRCAGGRRRGGGERDDVNELLPLAEASDSSVFGSKAAGLGEPMRAGLPVPAGLALSGPLVEAVASADEAAVERVRAAVRPLGGPLAVRSSAVDADGAAASCAGQHLNLITGIAGYDTRVT